MRKVLLLTSVVLILASLVIPATAQDSMQKILDRGKVLAVLDATIPPLAFVDPVSGDVKGFCVDLITLYAQKLNVGVEITNSEWAGVIPSLLTGKVDVIAANLTTTIPRTAKLTYTDPWLLTGSVAIVKENSTFKSLDDLNAEGVKIGITKGSLYEPLVPADFPKAEILTFTSKADWTEALLTGRIDAVIDAEVLLLELLDRYPDQFRFLPGYYLTETYAFAVQQGDWVLRDSLNIFFREIKLSGEYAKLYRKWFGFDWTPVTTGSSY